MAGINNHILGLDIGSARIKAAVGELGRDGRLTLERVFRLPSAGLRRGMVDDVGEVTRTINYVIHEVKKHFKLAHKRIFLNTGGVSARVHASRGIVAVSRADYEIYKDDIERAVQASQAINLPANRMIVHAITKEFLVDGVGDIKDPLGMSGNRLEASSLIIDAFAPAIQRLTKAVEAASGGVSGLIFGPLASAAVVLSRAQKDLGVVLVDIGAATTALCLYEEGKLLHIAVLPVGAGYVTNDLAIGLRTSIEAAEAIKCSFGYAISRTISGRDLIDLGKIDSHFRTAVSRRMVAEIIEDRLREIFVWVNEELKQVNRAGKLPAGVVLVGGGAKLPGLAELARQELRLPARIGEPDLSVFEVTQADMATDMEDPEYTCCLGLLLWGKEHLERTGTMNLPMGSWFKRLVGYFVP